MLIIIQVEGQAKTAGLLVQPQRHVKYTAQLQFSITFSIWQSQKRETANKMKNINLVAFELETVDSSSLQVHLAGDQDTFLVLEKPFLEDPVNQVHHYHYYSRQFFLKFHLKTLRRKSIHHFILCIY